MHCRVCGCSPAEPCELEVKRSAGRLSADPAVRMVQRAERARGPARTCELRGTICTRCIARGEITDRQLGELARIQARHGTDVHAHAWRGLIWVRIDGRPRDIVLRP